jgi:hypothetical protein
MVFTIFGFLIDGKIKPKVFKLLMDFENSSSNPLQRLKCGDFDNENAYRKPLVIL